MKTTIENRSDFACLLGHLMTERQLGLRALGRLAGVSHGLLSDIAAGRKCAGPQIAEQLADALQLNGSGRESFLLSAAATRKHDRLMKVGQDVSPEIVNHLPLLLADAGIPPQSVNTCTRSGNSLHIAVGDGRTLTLTAELKMGGPVKVE
jgi:hypothetical protein